MFVIEDELHAEWIGEFPDRESALGRLRELAEIPWDQPPNLPPCMSWRTCGRNYQIYQYDPRDPERLLGNVLALSISAEGVTWHV